MNCVSYKRKRDFGQSLREAKGRRNEEKIETDLAVDGKWKRRGTMSAVGSAERKEKERRTGKGFSNRCFEHV